MVCLFRCFVFLRESVPLSKPPELQIEVQVYEYSRSRQCKFCMNDAGCMRSRFLTQFHLSCSRKQNLSTFCGSVSVSLRLSAGPIHKPDSFRQRIGGFKHCSSPRLTAQALGFTSGPGIFFFFFFSNPRIKREKRMSGKL